MPYILLRFFIYSAFGLIAVAYFVVVYFVGRWAAPLHEYAGPGVWIASIVFSFPFVKLIREYLLYVVKAGHVAVIAELAMKGSLPEGTGQISWGKTQVIKTFKSTSVLFLADRLVHGVIGAINRMMWKIGNVLSGIPGIQGLVKLFNLILYFSLTYIDEAIMARNFLNPKETAWESSKVGLVLYAQIWKQILGSALLLGLIALVFSGLLAVVLLMPALGLAMAFPRMDAVFVIAALVFAAVIKFALFDPWTMSIMVVTYLKEIEGKIPDKSWEAKLENVSNKFKQIKEKAQDVIASPKGEAIQ